MTTSVGDVDFGAFRKGASSLVISYDSPRMGVPGLFTLLVAVYTLSRGV